MTVGFSSAWDHQAMALAITALALEVTPDSQNVLVCG